MFGRQVYACATCGTQFLQYASQIGKRAFCSKACYSKALEVQTPYNKGKRTVVTALCQHCGAAISGVPSQVGRRKFCSRACSAASMKLDLGTALSRYRVVDGGCWLWEGVTRGGYGRLKLADHGMVEAHRASYEFHVGKIAEDLVIDHLCRNRSCINPQHLEPVTEAENIRRGQQGSPEAMRKYWETRRRRTANGSNCGDGTSG